MDWSKLILSNIAQSDGLHISPLRTDAKTYGTPTWIWVVSVAESLYVRAYSGKQSSWYQAAITQGAGQIISNGVVYNVRFQIVDDEDNDLIDEAYRSKYRNSRYLQPMVSARSRAATVQIFPLDEAS